MTYLVIWTQSMLAKASRERGAGLAEYALLLFVVAVAAAAVVGTFGDNIVNAFTGASAELPATTLPPAGP